MGCAVFAAHSIFFKHQIMRLTFQLFLFFFLTFGLYSFAQNDESVLLFDDFTNDSNFVDLTKKIIWSDSEVVTSGFQLNEVEDISGTSNTCISLTEEAMQKAGYKPGTVLASQAFDFALPEKIDRNRFTLKVEFDALWDEINNPGTGESGRLVVTLLHDYKTEIPFNEVFNLAAEAPFGRPAYNIRIRNHNKENATGTFMMYGGGKDTNGEVEKYNDEYWLPGFSSEPGGTSPGSTNIYPYGPTMRNDKFVTVGYPNWKHYTWIIKPERMEFYVRDAELSELADELVCFMQIPKTTKPENQIIDEINTAHNTNINQLPVMYNWFPTIEAVRIYFRGIEQTHFSNIKVSKIETPTAISDFKIAQQTNFNIYPNPCISNFNIERNSVEKSEYFLFGSNGVLIKQGVLEANQTTKNINVEQLTSGIYMLRIQGVKTIYNHKIVIN